MNTESPQQQLMAAVTLHKQGQTQSAIDNLKKLVSEQPQFVEAYFNLGLLLQINNQLNEALVELNKALSIDATHKNTLKAVTNIFIKLNRYAEAVSTVERALKIEPSNANLLSVHANLLSALRQYARALSSFNEYLKLVPNDISALIERGNTLIALGCADKSLADFDSALKIDPNHALALINKAIALNKCRLYKQAAECYERAANLLQHDAATYVTIILNSQYICDWHFIDNHIKKLKNILDNPDFLNSAQLAHVMPSALFSIPGITPQELLLFSRKYVATKSPETPRREFHHPSLHSKIHIGYFSADFREHPVSQLIVEVLELHDHEQFIISAYSARKSDHSKLRSRIESCVDRFIDITEMDDASVVDKIIADQVDILIDLSGYTDGSRSQLLALRPAPIQVNYLGCLGTTGANFIDYLMADDFLITPQSEIFYTEKIVRLPSYYQGNDKQLRIPEQLDRASYGLPEEGIIFCCFNLNYKITSAVFDVWCQLLRQIPNSFLWLYASNQTAQENLYQEANRRGIDKNRLIFAAWLPMEQHVARMACGDLFLDTTPYNAGTTAINALWAGIPVVTCSGLTAVSRAAGSLLTALNVPELITYNLEDYYQLAYELATQHERRELLRQKIIANKETALLFDSLQFTQNLEAAYRAMFNDYQKNNPGHSAP